MGKAKEFSFDRREILLPPQRGGGGGGGGDLTSESDFLTPGGNASQKFLPRLPLTRALGKREREMGINSSLKSTSTIAKKCWRDLIVLYYYIPFVQRPAFVPGLL